MKIGFVLDDSLDKADGVQQYVLTLGKWLRSQGHDVHYLVGQTERRDLPHVHSLSRNIQVHFNQNRMTTPLPAPKVKIKKLLDKEKFDVLHVQLPHSPFMAARIVKLATPQTAVIGTFHVIPFSGLEEFSAWVLGLWLRRNLKRFDQIFSVSEPAAEFARKSFKIETKVLPNAVDTNFFHSAKTFRKYEDGLVNIVFLGRLVERKGCLYLLKALQKLHAEKRLDGVRVFICGKGPLRHKLDEFVKKNHLSRHVHFTGFVSEADKARYLKTAQIAIFPSTGGESFGIILIEAMAAGSAAVLAGDNIGYKSVLSEQPKQLIDPNNTVEFARTLAHFISNKKSRSLAQKWQNGAVRKYDVRIVGSKLLEHYQTALHKTAEMR